MDKKRIIGLGREPKPKQRSRSGNIKDTSAERSETRRQKPILKLTKKELIVVTTRNTYRIDKWRNKKQNSSWQ